MFNNWQIKHLEQYSLLLLEGILTIEHQTLYFSLPKRLTVLKVTQEFEHRSETKYGLFRKVTHWIYAGRAYDLC